MSTAVVPWLQILTNEIAPLEVDKSHINLAWKVIKPPLRLYLALLNVRSNDKFVRIRTMLFSNMCTHTRPIIGSYVVLYSVGAVTDCHVSNLLKQLQLVLVCEEDCWTVSSLYLLSIRDDEASYSSIGMIPEGEKKAHGCCCKHPQRLPYVPWTGMIQAVAIL